MYKHFKKLISKSITLTLFFGFIAFSPSALAIDKFVFNPTPADEYELGESYEVKVTLALEQGSYVGKFYIKKVGDLFGFFVSSYDYTGINETHTFEWDGKFDDEFVEPGNYQAFILDGGTNETVLTHDFSVKKDPNAKIPVLTFNNPPKDLFNIEEEAKMDFQVRLTQFVEDVEVTLKIEPLEGGSPFNVKTIEYTESGTNVFSWDGKKSGQDVEPGEYRATFTGEDLSPLSFLFNVVTAEPKIEFDGTPKVEVRSTDEEYEIPITLSDFNKNTKVIVGVVISDSNLYIPQAEYTFTGNGDHTFNVDISDFEPGKYPFQIKGEDIDQNVTNTLEGEFTIKEGGSDSGPTLMFNSTPSDEYERDSGLYTFSVKLTDYDADTLVNAFITDAPNQPDTPKDNFNFTQEGQSHEFKIDLSDYPTGTYELEVYGEDENDQETNVLTHEVEVVNDTQNPDSESCAGYKDLKKSDWSCEAAIWAKEEGIIEGQGNGDYLDGYSFLNRYELAKISLMAYEKYDEGTDYCDGTKAFSDVPLGQWFSEYVCLGKSIKMITGYLSGPDKDKFVGNRPVTLAEMFCILLRPLNEPLPAGPSYSGMANNQWYSGCAAYAKNNDYFSATNMLPTTEATRFNVLNFLYELHQDGKI